MNKIEGLDITLPRQNFRLKCAAHRPWTRAHFRFPSLKNSFQPNSRSSSNETTKMNMNLFSKFRSDPSDDVPTVVFTKGDDEKTAVTFDDDEELVIEKPMTDRKAEVQAQVQQVIVEQKRLREGQQKILAQTDEILENQDQMKSQQRKTEAKIDVLEEAVKQTPLKVKEMMETMLDTYVKSAVKEIKDAQGGQLKTPAAKKKKRNADSASVAGRPPISTAKKSRPSTLSIPGVEKHTMRQSEDAKKLAFDKRREGRIVT
mmetsp:Transcript_1683/g.3577  ORF Transcript_1683/g.3577 Transcript_1683/m.3577 type:complete len:259 (+) Transcript_1683:2503-3279(+)